MTLLGQIVDAKRLEVASASRKRPLSSLEREVSRAPFVRTFAPNPSPDQGRPRIIAEMKRRSPSRGLIRDPYDPEGLAETYRKGGASALSILTDATFFGGSLEDLGRVRMSPAGETLPLLRKDFIIDPYQVWESRCAGADIDRHIRSATDLLDEVHELVGAESIRIDDVAPCRIHRGGALVPRADPLAPVILVRETAAGPADVGNLEISEGDNDVFSDPPRIWDLRIRPNPDAFVKPVSKILGELAKEVTIDPGSSLGSVNV